MVSWALESESKFTNHVGRHDDDSRVTVSHDAGLGAPSQLVGHLLPPQLLCPSSSVPCAETREIFVHHALCSGRAGEVPSTGLMHTSDITTAFQAFFIQICIVPRHPRYILRSESSGKECSLC